MNVLSKNLLLVLQLQTTTATSSIVSNYYRHIYFAAETNSIFAFATIATPASAAATVAFTAPVDFATIA